MVALLGLIPGVGTALRIIPPAAWKWIAILVAFLAYSAWISSQATNRAEAKCATAALQGERDKARLERDTALDQAKRASEAVAELDRGKTDAEARAADLQVRLSKASDACRLSPAAIERLRGGRTGTAGGQR